MPTLTDNTLNNSEDLINDWEDLQKIGNKLGNKTIKEIVGNSNLLVFPYKLDDSSDKIGEEKIFTLTNNQIQTGNVVGFIGLDGIQIRIRSRFAETDSNDYFLHYLLCKVCSINLFDMPSPSSNEPSFDFLLYLFPYYLKKALKQGLYKEYVKKEYNDSNVKGAIDVNRHLKYNVPFKGSVAYNTKEFNCDNKLTQLIRHTIEFIKTKPNGQMLLKNDSRTAECVRSLIQVTPNYSRRQRNSVINLNIRPIHHPYFSQYANLQKICLQILKYEKLKYQNTDDGGKISGILIDIAWLWEEYLNVILRGFRIIHPRNKTQENGIKMFNEQTQKDKQTQKVLYPDFYLENSVVLDAKYKLLKDLPGIDDLHQIITYMYILPSPNGVFVYPVAKDKTEPEVKKYILNGYGGTLSTVSLGIPSKNNWKDFCDEMSRREDIFIEELSKLVSGVFPRNQSTNI